MEKTIDVPVNLLKTVNLLCWLFSLLDSLQSGSNLNHYIYFFLKWWVPTCFIKKYSFRMDTTIPYPECLILIKFLSTTNSKQRSNM
jgi:hypothetical protein